jgi:hypothetical protein
MQTLQTEARMAVVQVLLKALQEGMNGAQTVGMKDTEEGAQAADGGLWHSAGNAYVPSQ